MVALAFSRDAAARECAAGELPEQPGGEIWCDLDRAAISGEDGEGHDPPRPRGSAEQWLRALHPVTRARLRRSRPAGFGTVHPEYVHVRVPLPSLPPADSRHPPRRGGPARLRPRDPAFAADPLDVVMGAGFAITVHRGERPQLLARLQRQYVGGKRRASGVDMAVYELLEAVVAPLRAWADRLIASTDELSQRLVDLRARRILREIVALRRHAAHLRGLAAPAVEALGVLEAAGPHRAIGQDCIPLYRDLLHQARELLGDIDDARDTLGQAVEAYTSVQSTEMNRIMQLFTVIAVIFMPPTLIASIYGMNFRIPEYRWPFGYAWALGLMGGVSGLLILWMHRKDWL